MKYWSAALVHAVYLHNCLVHLATSNTPFKYYYIMKPDLEYINSLSAMDGHDRPLKNFLVLWFLAKFLSVHGVW
jgi:hypothetical protein